MRNLIALLLVSCASRATPPAADFPEPPPGAVVEVAAEPKGGEVAAAALEAAAPAVSRVFADGVRSVRLRKRTSLRKQPRGDAAVIGVIKKGALAQVRGAAADDGSCDGGRWIELGPRGWVCEHALEPSAEEAPVAVVGTLLEEPAHEEAPVVRGVYGIVRRKSEAVAFASAKDALAQQNGRVLEGSNTVRARSKVTLEGRRYWRTTKGELIDASAIVHLSPSRFKGERIDDPAAMPAWIRSRHGAKEAVVTRAEAGPRARRTGELAPRTVVEILEESADGRYVRVADRAWVRRDDVRRAVVAPPPAGTQPDERWFDVDLDEQVLVAYEGARPVYATLVSTGKRKHRTPTLVARIVSKLEHAVMASERESYSVADVPWTMYYDGDYALHTSYWHDGFGGPRSHGCINLAPRDARLLYRWSSPDVPPGWSAVYGDVDSPGSLVRVRSRRAPAPATRGYARAVESRRLDVAFAP